MKEKTELPYNLLSATENQKPKQNQTPERNSVEKKVQESGRILKAEDPNGVMYLYISNLGQYCL